MEVEASRGDQFLGFLAYLGPFVLIPMLRPRKRRFLLFHTRQGLYLFATSLLLLAVVLGIFQLFTMVQFEFGQKVAAVCGAMVFLVWAAVSLAMALTTLRKRMVMLPIMGEFAGER